MLMQTPCRAKTVLIDLPAAWRRDVASAIVPRHASEIDLVSYGITDQTLLSPKFVVIALRALAPNG
jgi:hypothetical protein